MIQIVLRNGNFPKAKLKYFWEQFKTKEGLFDFIVGSIVWALLVLLYYQLVYNFIYTVFSPLESMIPVIGVWLRWALSLLIMGILLRIFGVYLSIGINKIYEILRVAWRKIVKG